MAISINCCLRPPQHPPWAVSLPPSTPPVNITKTSISPWPVTEREGLEGAWARRGLTVAVACVAIGIVGVESCCNAVELYHRESGAPTEMVVGVAQGRRWSDRRSCPAWNTNVLESVVPENLPRPSARRRVEAVGIDKTAPVVGGVAVLRHNSSCFSL